MFGSHTPPEPPRPLGVEGRKTWDRVWGLRRRWIDEDNDLEHVLLLAESMDERVGLRVRVFQNPDNWRDRVALRAIDEQIGRLIERLALTPVDREKINTGEVAENGRLAQLRAAR
jgi:hypothetical protein